MTERPNDDSAGGLTLYGVSSVAANGTFSLPADARRAMGIDGVAASVLVFGRPGRTVLTPVPLAEELLDFAAARAAERAAEPPTDDESANATGDPSS